MPSYDSDVLIQGIVIHPESAGGGFDITYAEQRDITQFGTIMRQLMVPEGVAEEALRDVLDALRELLDIALDARLETRDRISHKR